MIRLSAKLMPDTKFAKFTGFESTYSGKDFYKGSDKVNLAGQSWFKYEGSIKGTPVEFWITKFDTRHDNHSVITKYSVNPRSNALIHLIIPDATVSVPFPSNWWPVIKEMVKAYNIKQHREEPALEALSYLDIKALRKYIEESHTPYHSTATARQYYAHNWPGYLNEY